MRDRRWSSDLAQQPGLDHGLLPPVMGASMVAGVVQDGAARETGLKFEGLLFTPYLGGDRTPHMDAAARGTFIGLSLRHTPRATRSVR